MREPAIIPGSLVALTNDTSFVRTFTEACPGPAAGHQPWPPEGPALLNRSVAMVVCRPGRNMQVLLVWCQDDSTLLGWVPAGHLRPLQ